MPPVALPDNLTAATPTPTLFPYQSDSPAPATGYGADWVGGSLDPRCFTTKQQRPSSDPSGQEPDPRLDIGDIALPPPPPPHQLTHNSENPDTEADSARPGPGVCICGSAFQRQTDMERHLRTSKEHSRGSRGLVCPMSGCRYTSRFTRVDNFKVHYMKQHGMSSDEANSYIREWRSRGRL